MCNKCMFEKKIWDDAILKGVLTNALFACHFDNKCFELRFFLNHCFSLFSRSVSVYQMQFPLLKIPAL